MGGEQPPEETGINRVLAGLRRVILDDDQHVGISSAVVSGPLARFQQDASPPQPQQPEQ